MKARRASSKTTSSASASPENLSDSIEDEQGCLAEFPQIDLTEQCPKYTSIVDAKVGQVTIEELDPLQLELETLLVAVVHRKQQLRAQLEALDHDDTLSLPTKPPKAEKHKTPLSPPDAPAMKKLKAQSFESKSTKKPSKEKSRKTSTSFFESPSTSETPSAQKSNRFPVQVAPLLAKDSPHRFWAYLDDYCKPVGEEQIQVLSDMLKAQEAIKNSDYVKVPPLGTHYSVKWAQEDLLEEQRESTPDISSTKLREDMDRVLRKTAKESLNDETYGPLTQRLVSCLIEENIFVNPEDIPLVSKSNKGSSCNLASLEQRIRKELEDLGVMQALAEKVAEEDDEIFLELRKCQSQLLSISSQNVRLLKRVMTAARVRLAEMAIETQLRLVDDEIMEHFRKRKGVSKTKNAPIILVPPTKKEKEHLQSLLEKRKSILAQLDELTSSKPVE